MSAALLQEIQGGVLTLTLNRPDAGNAIDLELARALMLAAIQCDEDRSIRCVVLTGAGKLFCAGGDIAAFAAAGEQTPSLIKEMAAYLHSAIARFARMEKPLITAVNGAAAGAGFSLAILGDIALASTAASFNLAYSSIGLSPDGGATWMLPRLIGLRRAQELMMTGQRLSAADAAILGLVTRTVDATELTGEVAKLAMRLASGPTQALGRTRNLLLSSFSTSLETQMENEARAIAACAGGAEACEGVAAFLAKRAANFLV
jgi:2-(1,2-epoxy-1,2-dihydrophenyl)acetyl-CoA isomerase